MFPLDDTIAAVASAPGGAARGIVRLSGPGVATCVAECFAAADTIAWSAVTSPCSFSGRLRLEGWTPQLPCQLLFWPDGRSYTGQPVAELHTIGSPPLIEAALQAVCRAGARLAEPGEFTLRAFLSGRIDLTQAEAVLGVIDAAGPQELDTALAQLAGGLARPLHELRDRLLELLAHLEAGFDFPDEDLPFITPAALASQLAEAVAAVTQLAQRLTARSAATPMLRAVLLGRPNAGKSSLFNALAGATALVSAQPGTTRDYLVAELNLDGLKCQLVDTAGLDASTAGILGEAQSMTADQARGATVRLLCIDATQPWDSQDREQSDASADGQIVVLTKIDAICNAPLSRAPTFGQPREDSPTVIPTSAATGQGLDELRRALRQVAETASSEGLGAVAGTAARCGESLRLAAQCLAQAAEIARLDRGEELAAIEIRAALDELGKVVGAVYTEDLLDRVFSRFCVGK